MTWCLITGASSGIGRALAIHMSKLELNVIAIARREHLLQETKNRGKSSHIHVIAGDVATEQGRQGILDKIKLLQPEGGIDYVVHNAGVLGNIGKIEDLQLQDWKHVMAVNVEAPLFLTKDLIPYLSKNKPRILHIGSGAAHFVIGGWTAYNMSKAALYMAYQYLREELKPRQIFVGSVKPGIIDTEILQPVFHSEKATMRDVDNFKKLKNNVIERDVTRPHRPPLDALDNAENVAFFLDFLLRKTSPEEFSKEEWDIRDATHHARWICE